jgi:hypothetical protein
VSSLGPPADQHPISERKRSSTEKKKKHEKSPWEEKSNIMSYPGTRLRAPSFSQKLSSSSSINRIRKKKYPTCFSRRNAFVLFYEANPEDIKPHHLTTIGQKRKEDKREGIEKNNKR